MARFAQSNRYADEVMAQTKTSQGHSKSASGAHSSRFRLIGYDWAML
ncbi:MAG: hypothetical protein AAGF53_10135 [Pseudomonadota bacterium]